MGHGGRERENGHKPKHQRVPLNIRKHLCTVKVTECRHRLRREAVESLSLERCKTHPDMALLEQRGWTR